MNNILNGTSWGELPEAEYSLDIPDFMLPPREQRRDRIHVPRAAYEARAAGRVKHQNHIKDREHRNLVHGAVFMVSVFVFISVATLVMELICK
jgi:hypothetical protein